MTVDEFKSAIINDEAIVMCKDAEQRNRTLRFLKKLGFKLHETSECHIIFGNLSDKKFLCPGIERGYITCWLPWAIKTKIDYSDVPFSDAQELYIADDDEFSALFANLMG